MAVSVGPGGCGICVPGDAAKKGVAPGPGGLLDTESTLVNYSATAWLLGLEAFGVPGASDPAEVVNGSYGTYQAVDDDEQLRGTDKLVSSFGLSVVHSAGNDGPNASMLSAPCIAPNALCVGSVFLDGAVDPSAMRISASSSRGPSPAGRKKPDLVAVGESEVAQRRWIALSSLWTNRQGTSYAAPQVAGAATLLAGSGITDPMAIRAVLINSARNGRATPGDAMGTQTAWQPDWGWGAFDLTAALAQRTNADATRSVAGNGVRLYRFTPQAAGDRATLVWNRRVTGCATPGCPNGAMTLSNLDLFELDAATGATVASSTSAIDNVEQTRHSGATGVPVIVKVNAQSEVTGLAAEPYAITATRPLTALASPQPQVSLAVNPAQARVGDLVTVTATVTNSSADLSAQNTSVTLNLPAGVALAPGSGPVTQALGTLATGGQAPATWLVQGSADALASLTATANATRYGETFTGTAAANLLVDSTPPAVSITAPGGTQASTAIPVAWSASDAGSGVASYDVEVSTDGGAFTALSSATSATNTDFAGAHGHRYAFRARARDRLSNTSAFAASPITTVTKPAAPRASALLRLSAARWTMTRRTRRVTVYGRIRSSATSSVRVSARCYGTRTARVRTRRPRGGRFSALVPLTRACDSARKLYVVVSYGGQSTIRPATVRRTLTRRLPRR